MLSESRMRQVGALYVNLKTPGQWRGLMTDLLNLVRGWRSDAVTPEDVQDTKPSAAQLNTIAGWLLSPRPEPFASFGFHRYWPVHKLVVTELRWFDDLLDDLPHLEHFFELLADVPFDDLVKTCDGRYKDIFLPVRYTNFLWNKLNSEMPAREEDDEDDEDEESNGDDRDERSDGYSTEENDDVGFVDDASPPRRSRAQAVADRKRRRVTIT